MTTTAYPFRDLINCIRMCVHWSHDENALLYVTVYPGACGLLNCFCSRRRYENKCYRLSTSSRFIYISLWRNRFACTSRFSEPVLRFSHTQLGYTSTTIKWISAEHKSVRITLAVWDSFWKCILVQQAQKYCIYIHIYVRVDHTLILLSSLIAGEIHLE